MGFWPEYQGESKDLYHLKTIPGKPNSFLCCSSSMPTNLLSGSCLTREILFGARFILFLKVVMSSGMRMVRRDGMSLMWTGSDVNNRRGTTLKCQRAQKNLPILQLETMPPDVLYVDRWYFSNAFQCTQHQAHLWD